MKIKTKGRITYVNHENNVIGITIFHYEDQCDAPLSRVYATVTDTDMNEIRFAKEVNIVIATKSHGDYCQICGKTLSEYDPEPGLTNLEWDSL